MTQYLCAQCKDKIGWCKNWDGHSTREDSEKGFQARANACQMEPTTCEFYVVGKPREPLGGNNGQGN